MILITETLENTIQTRLVEDASTGKKSLFIEGTFAEFDRPNKNKRSYPKSIMEREVAKYQDTIKAKRALGELNHPPRPNIDPERASHLITELRLTEGDVFGKAKILSTGVGQTVAALLNDGVSLGVSTRGLGSLKMGANGINEVQDDYTLNTVDIVADPSANDAWVQGIMEGREWLMVEGLWVMAEKSKEIIRTTPKAKLKTVSTELFQKFLREIK